MLTTPATEAWPAGWSWDATISAEVADAAGDVEVEAAAGPAGHGRGDAEAAEVEGEHPEALLGEGPGERHPGAEVEPALVGEEHAGPALPEHHAGEVRTVGRVEPHLVAQLLAGQAALVRAGRERARAGRPSRPGSE